MSRERAVMAVGCAAFFLLSCSRGRSRSRHSTTPSSFLDVSLRTSSPLDVGGPHVSGGPECGFVREFDRANWNATAEGVGGPAQPLDGLDRSAPGRVGAGLRSGLIAFEDPRSARSCLPRARRAPWSEAESRVHQTAPASHEGRNMPAT